MNSDIKNNLKDLGFKDNEIKVYLALTQLGEAPASTIAKKTDLPRTTVIGVLAKLQKENCLSTNQHHGITQYWIESPKTIRYGLENKIKIADNLNELLTALYHTEHHFPFAETYDTKSSIKKFIEKSLIKIKKGATIYTIDHPGIGNYNKIYSDEFSDIVYSLKKKKQVKTFTLVPFGDFKQVRAQKLKQQDITIKELPTGIEFKSALWIMDDSVVHFSGQYPFVVAITHKVIADSMQSIFNYLWEISTPQK